MSSHLVPAVVIWGAVVILASLTVLAWRQQPKRAAAMFAIAMFCGTWWATTSALGLFAATDRMMVFWAKVEWAGVVFIPVAWLLFALEYTGRERFVTFRSAVGLSVVPTATLSLAMTNSFHELIYRSTAKATVGPLTVIDVQFGPWFWVHALYTYGLLLVGTLLILQVAVENRTLYSAQVVALVGVVTPPVVGGLMHIAGLGPFEALDPTPYTFIFSGVAGITALRRYRFLDAVPVTDRTARKSLVDEMDEGVVVVDGNDDVVQINPRARSLFADDASPVGRNAAAILPNYERLTDADGQGRDTVSLQRGGRERTYEVRITDLNADATERAGSVLVFHDVTQQRTRLQRLDVLNRVLRHNLRNEMNVVYGYADQIESESDPERRAELSRRIKEKTMSMVELGDRAREIDNLLEARDEADYLARLDRLLEWERDRLAREHPSLTIENDLPSRDVRCSTALETILAILDEAVLEHNDAEEPAIDIDASIAGENARIAVSDDGTGIPSHERQALESGEESDLRHGNSLDLWLANWGAQAIGGDLSIVDRGSEGTVAEITIPCEEPTAPSQE